MSLGTRLLVLIAPAILPPANSEEREFYELLGIPRNASVDDIKKAYRQKSLALHPDKIAHRRAHSEAQTAAAEYELVQEAYAALNDPKHRREYHAVQCSVARYRFLQSGAVTNQTALLENLSSASFIDRTKLVSVAVIVCLIVLLQPMLVAVKVNDIVRKENRESDYDDDHDRLLDVKWIVILIPWWLVNVVWLLMTLLLLFLETNKKRVISAIAGQTCWIVGWILLALAWDDPPDNWHLVATPFYIWQATQILSAVFDIREIRRDDEKMISPEKLQDLAGNEATEEDLMELAQQYTVVTVDHQAVAAAIHVINSTSEESLTSDEIEELKIQVSAEFQLNRKLIQYHTEQIARCCLVELPFIALVASRLEGQIDTSWWIVFLPILIYLGSKLLQSCCTYCFAILEYDEVAVSMEKEDDEEEKGESVKMNGNGEDLTDSFGQKDSSIPSDEKPIPNDKGTNEAENTISDKTEERTVDDGSALKFVEDEGSNKDSKLSQGTFDNNEAPSDERKNFETTAEEPSTAFAPVAGDIEDFNMQNESTDEKSPTADTDNDPKIDEETYRAWQSAYAKAEESAMDKQAKAQSTCCFVSFQLIMVCLVVGKLDEDYEADGQIGYNSFWILFPVFFIAGLILFCCSYVIYRAGSEDIDESSKPSDESVSGDNKVVHVPPPPIGESSTGKQPIGVAEFLPSVDSNKEKTETLADQEKVTIGDSEAREDMNDLD